MCSHTWSVPNNLKGECDLRVKFNPSPIKVTIKTNKVTIK